MKDFQEFAKLETAYEIMAYVINNKISKVNKEIDKEKKEQLENELEILKKEREEMYNGNQEIINKVINEYSDLVKYDVEDYKRSK